MSKKILTVTLNPAVDFTVEIPGFSPGNVNRVSSSRKDPGGKGINVATALSSGNISVDVTGFLGKDNSDIFKKHFSDNSISDYFIYVSGSTREGIKIVDTSCAETTDINFNGFNLNREDINLFLKNFEETIHEYDYVVLSGSLPLNTSEHIYRDLSLIAKNHGVFVIVDTSRNALLECINSGAVSLIKPNIDELIEIYPNLNDMRDNEFVFDKFILSLLDKVEMVALSLGEKGSKLYTSKGIFYGNAPKIDVKSTVGAGDTFLAGFIAGLYFDYEPEKVLATAISWAASKLTKYGPGLSKTMPPQGFEDRIIVRKTI
ncbi:MAG: 1-phosphofructokinase family hexose kinase [Spirochaetales bacterium]|nr:1-phosphofructokinase family hexose kinase [Spirochaetales bacterium]